MSTTGRFDVSQGQLSLQQFAVMYPSCPSRKKSQHVTASNYQLLHVVCVWLAGNPQARKNFDVNASDFLDDSMRNLYAGQHAHDVTDAGASLNHTHVTFKLSSSLFSKNFVTSPHSCTSSGLCPEPQQAASLILQYPIFYGLRNGNEFWISNVNYRRIFAQKWKLN